jgi:ABC-type sugar transport system ATPase subunit
MQPLVERIAGMRREFAGSAVTATEPVFGYMADALGLKMRNGRFQLAVMNGTEPSAQDIAAFEKDLKSRSVRVMLYNSQTGNALAERMRRIATDSGVPVVGVSESASRDDLLRSGWARNSKRLAAPRRALAMFAIELDRVTIARWGATGSHGRQRNDPSASSSESSAATARARPRCYRRFSALRPASGRDQGAGRRAGARQCRGRLRSAASQRYPMWLSGRDFVASALHGELGLPLTGRSGTREIERAIAVVEGQTLAARPLSQLSGGELQRLLLAQALLGKPKLLLLDEPLVNLDPHFQKTIVALVKRVQQSEGITVLFTAHEPNALLGAMDRVLYLGRGRAAIGSVDEVITGEVLSRLYGTPIDVLRVNERIVVVSGSGLVDADAHRHDA